MLIGCSYHHVIMMLQACAIIIIHCSLAQDPRVLRLVASANGSQMACILAHANVHQTIAKIHQQ